MRRILAPVCVSLVLGCASGGAGNGGDGRRDGGGGDASARPFDAALDGGDRTDADPDDAGARPDAPPIVDAGPDVPRVSGERAICETCDDDAQCDVRARCGELTVGGRACLPTCVPDVPTCPRAFTCTGVVALGENLCLPVGGPCCVDADADGYGLGIGCLGDDCDDADATRTPGRAERCDDRDDDCDGTVD
nr:MopE-related protein [Myxococcota bacterium]